MQASERGWELLHALSNLWPCGDDSAPSGNTPALPGVARLPDAGRADSSGAYVTNAAAPVVIGAVLNLLISITEAGLGVEGCRDLGRLAGACCNLESWLR